MIHLTNKQFKFLKHISKTESIPYITLNASERKIVKFLIEKDFLDVKRENLVRINRESSQPEHYLGKIISVSISEPGKSYISERKHSILGKWIPYIITTVISLLALAKSYGFGIDDFFIWCMQLLKQ